MEDFISNIYGSGMDYENIRLSGDNLSKKIKKLTEIGMMLVMEDVIDLTGTIFYFEVPFCAN